MRIEKVDHHPPEELFARLRNVTMLKAPEVYPYREAEIALREMPTSLLHPAQRYVLLPELLKVRALRWELARLGHDLFHLGGYLTVWVAGAEAPIDLLPPVVEESREADGSVVNIVNDGMHRVYLARLEWAVPEVVFIRGVPPHLPYYAFPNRTQWEGIDLLEDLPETYVKKWHRIPDYHTLYRNFNSAFENVGAPRGRFTRGA